LGHHIHTPRQTLLGNLWLTRLHALDIEQDRYADSDGLLGSILA
jgi:hypothetical protein